MPEPINLGFTTRATSSAGGTISASEAIPPGTKMPPQEPDASSDRADEIGRPPARDERERAAAAVRAMQDALAPQVDALYGSPSGMDVFEAFDHFGRAADALRYAVPGATGIALAELTAAGELLRQAAERSTENAIRLNPIASMTEEALASVTSWPTTHASNEASKLSAVDDARLVLTPTGTGEFILTDDGAEVARFAAEGDALAAVTEYMPPTEDTAAGLAFNTFLTPEGYESSDGRLWELGTVTWRDPPLALMFQDTASHGPGEPAPAWFAGAIDRVWRDPADASRIMGRGRLVPGPDGARAEGLIRAGLRGVSIDGHGGDGAPPVRQIKAVDAEGNPVSALVRYSDVRIMGAAVVPHPAFEPCCIWFDDEPTPERVTQTHGTQVPMDVQPTIVEAEPLAALVASSGGPAKPPKAWFHVPPPNGFQRVEVTPEGQITGHVGPAGTCHIGIPGTCETIPPSATGYGYFHRTTALTAEGEKVRCGWLTMDTDHMPVKGNPTAHATMKHYENTGTQVAKVRVVDTPHGPWMCGAVAPGLSEQTIWKLQGPDVSGDWRPIDGYNREMVAVLSVPVPGFMPRPEALVASGQIVAQIGTLPCDDCGPSTVEDFVTGLKRGIMEGQVALHDAILRSLRPVALAAIREKVSPEGMVEAARKANEPDAAQAWRERLRV